MHGRIEMSKPQYFYNLKEMLKPLTPGIDWAVVKGTHMTVVYYEMNGAAPMSIQPHKHDNEQLSLVVEGHIKLTTGDKSKILGAGELSYIPPGVMHKGELVGENLKMIDVFSPRRDDHYEKYHGMEVKSPGSTAFAPTLTEEPPLFINFNDYNVELKEGTALAPFNCHTMTAGFLQVGIDPGEDAHAHPQEQINTYLAGEMVMTVDGEVKVVGPGWVVVVPPDVKHSGLMTKPALQVNFSSPSRGPGYADFLRDVFNK
jgi:quercetin dioxygenase-like cupin family protein